MRPNFRSPLITAYVSSGWVDPRPYRNGLHEGIDLRAAIGTPVYATASGEVVNAKAAGTGFGGNSLRILHADGWMSYYAHLSELFVERGDTVNVGQVIALSGDSGAGGPHLHYGTFLHEDSINGYMAEFGTPLTGFSPDGVKITNYLAVPSEPIIPAEYSSKVKERAAANKVPIYRAASLVAFAAVVGGGYVAWRAFSRRAA